MVPRLLSGQEAHLSSTLRHRGQRSLDVPGGGHSDPDNIILSLPAFGRNLYLSLTRDSKFLSGDFVVEERRGDQSAAVSRLSTNQLCFYSGSILNHTQSLASVSTCGGLVNPSSFLGLVDRFHVIQSKQLSSKTIPLNAPKKGVWFGFQQLGLKERERESLHVTSSRSAEVPLSMTSKLLSHQSL